jgi:predicted amidohydrolase YtcJ
MSRVRTHGPCEVGKLADMVILSHDIFNIDALRIRATKVVTTIGGGRPVYQADSK